MHPPPLLIGIALMCTAAACFVVSNALVKQIGHWLPTGEMLFIRGGMAALILLAVALASGTRPLSTIGRAPVLFLASLTRLPLANATAIELSAPLILTVQAVVFLGERVPVQRWLAITVGFVGVLLVLQPSANDFNGATLLCLPGTGLHAASDLLTRRSLLCAVASLRRDALSIVAPFRCLSLPFALLLGVAMWDELPGPLAWAGNALIALSALCVLCGAKRLPKVFATRESGWGVASTAPVRGHLPERKSALMALIARVLARSGSATESTPRTTP